MGAVTLYITPEDAKYREGWYYIGVYGYKHGTNSYTLSVTLADPGNFRRESLAPVTSLNSKETVQFAVSPLSAVYFRYDLKGSPIDIILHILATPGIDKAEMYISNETIYPSSEVFKWAVKNPAKATTFSTSNEADPFILNDKNELEYAPSAGAVGERKQGGDSMATKIDGYYWKHSKKVCYVGFHNITSGSLKASLTLTEFREVDLIPKEVSDQLACFAKVFEKVEGGSISQSERHDKKLTGSQYTYGEILPLQFFFLLKMAKPKPNGVFWDLGSGTGKALITAALEYPDFKKICGVELLGGLYDAGVSAVKRYCEISKTDRDKFKLVKGDMTQVDWSDADLIYTSSICFPGELIEKLAEKGKGLKPGTKIISLKSWGLPEVYKIAHSVKVKMTWGNNGVYILERI